MLLYAKLEDITDKDQRKSKRVWKEFGIKNSGEYHDLYVHSNKLLLADVSINFGICIKIYGLHPHLD